MVGSMSHMCVDGITRAANDLGYSVTVIHDACATRDLEFNGLTVPAAHVHAAFMSALGLPTPAWCPPTNSSRPAVNQKKPPCRAMRLSVGAAAGCLLGLLIF